MEIEDRVETLRVEQVDVALYRVLVVRAGVGRVDPIDAQPAVLVHRYADGVDPPGLHHVDRGRVGLPVEDGPALLAGVFAPGVVDAVDLYDLSTRVHELVALHVQRGRAIRRAGCCRRPRGRC